VPSRRLHVFRNSSSTWGKRLRPLRNGLRSEEGAVRVVKEFSRGVPRSIAGVLSCQLSAEMATIALDVGTSIKEKAGCTSTTGLGSQDAGQGVAM
jgi:hypothetical protein